MPTPKPPGLIVSAVIGIATKRATYSVPTRSLWPAILLTALSGVVVVLSGCDTFVRRDAKGNRYAYYRVEASQVTRFEITLAPGARTTLEARSPSDGALPVLHLWDIDARAEVARDAPRGLWGGNARISYSNRGRGTRNLTLILYAANDHSRGLVDVYRDGQLLARRVPVGGTVLEVASGKGYIYQAAAAPGGIQATSMYALDRGGRLLALDDGSGPLGLPLIKSSARIQYLIVGPREIRGSSGPVNVYVNDPRDRDGDGLGRSLERALGTCDSPNEARCARSPLAAYYRAKGTRDTDRDGLLDGDELFGVGNGYRLDLPRWGADPRHKDLFLEVDRQKRVGSEGLSEANIAALAQLFTQGSAEVLRNPDGQPGVRLHLDVGFNSSDPKNAALLGDWGGANTAKRGGYLQTRESDFDKKREGYFRYALLTRSGTGQASGDSVAINRDRNPVQLFAHELGHTLGLNHEGYPSWGSANCKPNYFSVMNYAYQFRSGAGFSTTKTEITNPARISENNGINPFLLNEIIQSPFEFDRIENAVDWNRDGLISDKPVRAGITWATYKSCGAAEYQRQILDEGPALAATPVLVRSGDYLHALWLDLGGHLYWRRASLSAVRARDLPSQCGAIQDNGAEWSRDDRLPGLSGLREIAGATADDGQIALAYLNDSSLIHVAVLSADIAGPHLRSDVEIPGASSDQPLSAAWMQVNPARYGVERVFGVWWRSSGRNAGILMQATALNPLGPYFTEKAIDAEERDIFTSLGPTVIPLGTGELCGVFTDAQSFIRFYCYDRDRDQWIDRSEHAFYARLGPRTAGKVGLAYHRYRDADGAAVSGDPSRGAVYLSYTERASSHAPDNPRILISEWLTSKNGAFSNINFRWQGSFITDWNTLAPGTGVYLYEDESLIALKGLMIGLSDSGEMASVEYLPFADGTYDEPLGSGNDFQVMERGICLGLRGEQYCGDKTTAAY